MIKIRDIIKMSKEEDNKECKKWKQCEVVLRHENMDKAIRSNGWVW